MPHSYDWDASSLIADKNKTIVLQLLLTYQDTMKATWELNALVTEKKSTKNPAYPPRTSVRLKNCTGLAWR
jgi:hypothetical protein